MWSTTSVLQMFASFSNQGTSALIFEASYSVIAVVSIGWNIRHGIQFQTYNANR